MTLRSLLRKEALTVRRNLALFIVLLVVVPGALVAGTVVYDQTIPEDLPVAVAPAEEATTEADLQLVRGSVQFFASPVEYEDRAAAVEAMEREEVYLSFLVPPDLTDGDAEVTMTVLIDGTYAPLSDPAELTIETFGGQFGELAAADVELETERIGTERSLSEFLVPSALFALVVLYGLVYIPYQVREERRVMDRLRTETRLELVVASKLLFYGALVAIPAATASAATRYFGHDFGAFAPETLLVLFVSFLLLAASGLAVLFAMRLKQAAVFVNLGLSVGVLAFTSLIYPIGFYSELRLTIAQALPTHYALVVLRSTMLRETPLSTYTDHLGWLLGATLLALFALGLALRHYERGGVHE